MEKVRSIEELNALRDKIKASIDPNKPCVYICGGTGCKASGADKARDALLEVLKAKGLSDVKVKMTGCHGFCEKGALMIVEPYDIFYCHVKAEDMEEIVETTIMGNGKPVERLLYHDPVSGNVFVHGKENPFYTKQKRTVLANCGHVDAESVEDYIAKGGFVGLSKAIEMGYEKVIAEMLKSGLRGRGGAGFPTGKKWQAGRDAKGDGTGKKYMVCNGDEGDPGAFMDRSIMEGDPYKLIEGMTVGALAVGADEGYIYVRAEYPLAIKRLRIAIQHCMELGLLGENILGTDFSFVLKIKEGAGAFVCGESTALTSSIEGKRGMPRVRPPQTTEAGLWEKPTVLNNVETYASVPDIMVNGGDWYAAIGTEDSKGTKAFAISGKVNRIGLAEVPLGMTLRELIFDIAGGVPNGKAFKAVQMGGPSGGCLTADDLDTPIEYVSLQKAGAIMGSGGAVIVDEDSCMVDFARFFMDFTQRESCGKCIPCREGTKRMLEIMQRICDGKGKDGDIELLEELGRMIISSSLCGLGKTAPNPVLSTIAKFRNEYEDHIYKKKCTAKACSALLTYSIDASKCKGCTKCVKKACPVGAISGEAKKPHKIDKNRCVKCGGCYDICPFGAVVKD